MTKHAKKLFQLGQAIADVMPKQRSLEDVGKELNLNPETVRYIQNMALAKLFYRVRARLSREEAVRTPGVLSADNWKTPVCYE